MKPLAKSDALKVPCPVCQAPIGGKCIIAQCAKAILTSYREEPHQERVKLATLIQNRHSLALYDDRPDRNDALISAMVKDGFHPSDAMHVIVIVKNRNGTVKRRRGYGCATGNMWKCYFRKRDGGIQSNIWTVYAGHLVDVVGPAGLKRVA